MDQCGDKAAAFHLARHMEAGEDFVNAVKYFSKAGAFSYSIRLARVRFFFIKKDFCNQPKSYSIK